VANLTIPAIIIVDPTAAFPAAFAPGETVLLQRAPNGLVMGIYNYSGGAAPTPELTLTAPAASQAETRALAILSTMRAARFP
jgi:hypothetical protein